MSERPRSRREWLQAAATAVAAASLTGTAGPAAAAPPSTQSIASAPGQGNQRLPLSRLRQWESLHYGMFIHFGMSTFTGKPLDDGKSPARTYAPDRLDVNQWVSVARDAGMKYAILTAKHHSGHCLWPSRHTTYTVEFSGDKTDVVERFVTACRSRGILPGLYYASWDNHHRFGSRTPSDGEPTHTGGDYNFREMEQALISNSATPIPAFVSSTYQDFQTAQIEELLGRYGPIAEVWIDIPNLLGSGYRDYLYHRIAELHSDAVIMMNNGIGDGKAYDPRYAWPSDLIALEKDVPPQGGHRQWRDINGRLMYLPGEACTPIGEEWFFAPNDHPREDDVLVKEYQACRSGGVNWLLDAPPDRHGLIPDSSIQALQRLRRAARI